ncbi:tRNA (cytosine(34)-C(5))-methyltransferase [Cucumispora dikerogammari]|nr:tRNA (cytosine(34)-C(5))-methyltransferase [Cucumispora dikerogammari]
MTLNLSNSTEKDTKTSETKVARNTFTQRSFSFDNNQLGNISAYNRNKKDLWGSSSVDYPLFGKPIDLSNFANFYSNPIFNCPDLLKHISSPLPVTFILNKTCLKATLKKLLLKYESLLDIKTYKSVRKSDDLVVYTVGKTNNSNNVNKNELKKSASYKELNSIINMANELGLITRQEFVSMMPVHFFVNLLYNNSHSRSNDYNENNSKEKIISLDLCAAPGSKSQQLMNISKLLVCNDVNSKRLNVLITNINKKQKYAVDECYVICTKYDAKSFPLNAESSIKCENADIEEGVNIHHPPLYTSPDLSADKTVISTADLSASIVSINNNNLTEATLQTNLKGSPLSGLSLDISDDKAETVESFFSNASSATATIGGSNNYTLVLCDVPCSGDGTLKKNPHILSTWTQPTSLFPLQYRILCRGIDILLKSRASSATPHLIYSTCSLNPLENEFIVCSILQKYKNIRLKDTHEICKDIKRNPGITAFEFENINLSKKEFKRIVKDFDIPICSISDINNNNNGGLLSFSADNNKPDTSNINNIKEYNNNKTKTSISTLDLPDDKTSEKTETTGIINNYSNDTKTKNIKMKYKFNNSELNKCSRFMPTEAHGGFFIAVFCVDYDYISNNSKNDNKNSVIKKTGETLLNDNLSGVYSNKNNISRHNTHSCINKIKNTKNKKFEIINSGNINTVYLASISARSCGVTNVSSVDLINPPEETTAHGKGFIQGTTSDGDKASENNSPESSSARFFSLPYSSTRHSTLFELPAIYIPYLFPLTEYAGIQRLVKEKKLTSNLLIRNLQLLSGRVKTQPMYRYKNVDNLTAVSDYNIDEDNKTYFIKGESTDSTLAQEKTSKPYNVRLSSASDKLTNTCLSHVCLSVVSNSSEPSTNTNISVDNNMVIKNLSPGTNIVSLTYKYPITASTLYKLLNNTCTLQELILDAVFLDFIYTRLDIISNRMSRNQLEEIIKILLVTELSDICGEESNAIKQFSNNFYNNKSKNKQDFYTRGNDTSPVEKFPLIDIQDVNKSSTHSLNQDCSSVVKSHSKAEKISHTSKNEVLIDAQIYTCILALIPLGPIIITHNNLFISCRVSGKVEPYLNERERNFLMKCLFS